MPGGEEFEAQGPQEFIERERARFLQLIKQGTLTAATPNFPGQTANQANNAPGFPGGQANPTPAFPGQANPTSTFPGQANPTSALPGQANPIATNVPVFDSARVITPGFPSVSQPHTTPGQPQLRLWEHLFKEDGTTLLLRQRAKLPAPDLALLLLAGARILLQKEHYSALDLAHSFKACGGKEGRLDRMLAPELQAGRIQAAGAKRSRTYHITAEGFARAYALAEKLLQSNPANRF